jgi:hypothetical protein
LLGVAAALLVESALRIITFHRDRD